MYTESILVALSIAYLRLRNNWKKFLVGSILISFLAYRCTLYSDRSYHSILDLVADSIANCPFPIRALVGDILGLVILTSCVKSLLYIYSILANEDLTILFKEFMYKIIRPLPAVQAELTKEKQKLSDQIENSLKFKSRALGPAYTVLPLHPVEKNEILDFLRTQSSKENISWSAGRVSGVVYQGDVEHSALLNESFSLYSLANPLHPDCWPSVMKLESEVVAMTAGLVSGSCTTVCGSTSSGGTESIILAIKAHREMYRDQRGVSEPEMICGVSAHAAVDKACVLMGIRLIKVPLDNHFRVSVSRVRRAISPNTILIYASAPGYPQGAIDPIEELSDLAYECGIGLHVDCCLGGFVLPFAVKLGYSVTPFDFSCRGVTSMSIDTHKYGCALKGSSVVLYRHEEIRRHQYFCFGNWTGGLYTTPTIAGSRSSGLIAQCWASMLALGEDGYMRLAKGIMETTREIAEGIRVIPGLRLLGQAEAMIVCFTGDAVNIYAISDAMKTRGWLLNSLQSPAAVHLCVTARHFGKAQVFLEELRLSVLEVQAAPSVDGGSVAIYGATASLPPGPVNELLQVYNSLVLEL